MSSTIPKRNEIPKEDRWDLSSLFENDELWEKSLKELAGMIDQASTFSGTLGSSASQLKACMDYLNTVGMLHERLEYYAFLRYAEDAGDSGNQARMGKISQTGARLAASLSFIQPELLEIPEKTMEQMLSDKLLQPYAVKLRKMLVFRPYTGSASEERILALQADSTDTPSRAFEALTNVDMDFGTVAVESEEKPLSQSTLAVFLTHPDKSVRKSAYTQFYRCFDQHKNTLSALYSGSVKQDASLAQIKGYSSSRAMALYPDQVSESVYDNLIVSVREGLDALHRCYDLKRRYAELDELHHYDLYLPFTREVETRYPFDTAVDTVCEALAPLGEEYVETLRKGLKGGWVDKYENRGKRSGAFSAGSYSGYPYILMNYKEDVLRDLFTLAHEAGHSMHSWYSARSNPFQHYSYTIFEAEVASTFNEQLLADYLLKRSDSPAMEGYIIGKQLDDITATVFRQTMFAEFEHRIHRLYEEGTPLTTDLMRGTYRELMEQYLGSGVVLEPESDLEGLRIPHFYRAFYVYKYATGLSAALALSKMVMDGGTSERDRYLSFLCSGGRYYPIDSLKTAGVDMTSTEPAASAVSVFSSLLDRIEQVLG